MTGSKLLEILKSNPSIEDNNEIVPPPVLHEEIIHLANFLKYLNKYSSIDQINFDNSNLVSNYSTSYEYDDKNDFEILPSALTQFLILLLVIIFLIFICKCNSILMCIRNNFDLTPSENEKKFNFKDIYCYPCNKIKMKKRFKKRRLRNAQFNKKQKRQKNTPKKSTSSLYRYQRTSSNFATKKSIESIVIFSSYTFTGSKTKQLRTNKPFNKILI